MIVSTPKNDSLEVVIKYVVNYVTALWFRSHHIVMSQQLFMIIIIELYQIIVYLRFDTHCRMNHNAAER